MHICTQPGNPDTTHPHTDIHTFFKEAQVGGEPGIFLDFRLFSLNCSALDHSTTSRISSFFPSLSTTLSRPVYNEGLFSVQQLFSKIVEAPKRIYLQSGLNGLKILRPIPRFRRLKPTPIGLAKNPVSTGIVEASGVVVVSKQNSGH